MVKLTAFITHRLCAHPLSSRPRIPIFVSDILSGIISARGSASAQPLVDLSRRFDMPDLIDHTVFLGQQWALFLDHSACISNVSEAEVWLIPKLWISFDWRLLNMPRSITDVRVTEISVDDNSLID